MESWVLLMLGLAVAATALSPAQEEFSYVEAISLAIDCYNREPGVPLAFRLLEAEPQPKWDPSIQTLQELEFRMQETTCPPSEQLNPDNCGFKDNGVVEKCSGTIFPEQGDPVIELSCETVDNGRSRVRRGILHKLYKKTKKRIKKIFHPHG